MTSNQQAPDNLDGCASPSDQYLQHHQPVEDLVELRGLDDEVVVENIRSRYLAGTPYTGAGSAMIALNPCRSLVEVYGRGMQSKYMRYNRTDLPAHVYGVGAAAYWALCEGRGSQEIILGGESGSGKSFTASVVLDHLIAAAHLTSPSTDPFVSQPWPPAESANEEVGVHVEEHLRRLVACHRTILESFGNARTPLSENSSRFALHTKVFFSRDASRVRGVESITLRLEASRLSGWRPGGKTFHVFYQILNADEEMKKRVRLEGKTAADFRLTAESQRGQAPGGIGLAWRSEPGNSSYSFSQDGVAEIPSRMFDPLGSRGTLKDTTDAMTAVGIAGTEVDCVLRGVSAVLHLHQIDFKDVGGEEIHRNFDAVQVYDEAPFEAAREMLGCKKHDLLNALLTRRLAAGGVDSKAHVSRESSRRRRQRGGEMLVVPLNRQEAEGARDKLAQEVYLRLFRWLVKRVNASTCLPPSEERQDALFVGLLDTQGVENMELSGFEQLCRNYSAEKIRGKILQGEVDTGSGCEKRSGQKRMWVHEAVALAKRSREILAMFEGPLGLIRLADAETSRPEGSNRSFVGKLPAEMSRQQQQQQPEDDGGMSAEANGDDDDDYWCVRGSGGRHGVAGSLGGACPVYAADPKSDGRADPSFYINHFGGLVQYTAANFLEKNESEIGENLLDLLDGACTNELIGIGSRCDRYRDKRRASTKDGTDDHRAHDLHDLHDWHDHGAVDEPVLSQHQRQLTRLIDEIGSTEVRHIICVKPNEELSPAYLDSDSLLRQLSAAGVLAVARVESLLLPSGRRVDKEAFFNDFRGVPSVLQRVLSNEGNICRLGHNVIFFREGAWEALKLERQVVEVRSCEVVQRAWRRHAFRIHVRTEWERHLAAQDEKRATDQRLRREVREINARQRAPFDAVLQSPSIASFGSFNANAVREAQRAREAQVQEEESRRWQRVAHNAIWAESAAGEGAAAVGRQEMVNEEAAATAEAAIAAAAAGVVVAVDSGAENVVRPLIAPTALVEAWPVVEEPEGQAPSLPCAPRCRALPVRSSSSRSQRRGRDKSAGATLEAGASLRLTGLTFFPMRAFLTGPVPRKYGAIRCRVTRRRDGGWNKALTWVYHLHHIEDGMGFMMSATQQGLSRTANYYISASPALEMTKYSRHYLGKLRAHDGSGRAYTLYDHGISPGRSSKDRRRGLFTRTGLAAVTFSSTRGAADGPRSMEASIGVDSLILNDANKGRGGGFTNYEQHRQPGTVRMRDRKPRYDCDVRAYVLDFPDCTNGTTNLSVKNVQLVLADSDDANLRQKILHRVSSDDERCVARDESESGTPPPRVRGEEWKQGEGNGQDQDDGGELMLLSFGKSGTDEFALDFRWPLSPMQAFGLALAALDTSV